MTDAFVETPAERADGRLQIFAAIFLGLAATLTALSAYQAALLDGDALQGYSESNSQLSDSNYFYNQGNQTLASDQQFFVQYALATKQDAETSEYLKTLMRPELVSAIDWWIEAEDAITPFDEVEDNPYEIVDFAEGETLEKQSKATFKAGAKADNKGDEFELSTVLFALTLFFGGIATLFARRKVAIALLGIAGIALIAGGVQLATAFAA